MSKQQNRPISSSHKQPSVGVGEYYADPEREIVEWTALYFEGKFYLSDPYSIAKLQEIQSEIDLQQKLAFEFRGDDMGRAESQRSFNNNVDASSYSCATEKSPQKMRLKQLKAEKELYREEEAYMNKLIELKKRRKELENKKTNKNLISVKQATSKSVKEVPIKNESLKGKSIHKEPLQTHQKVQIQPQNTIMHSEKVQLPKQSKVTINLDQLQPIAFNPVILQSPSIKQSHASKSIKQIQESIIQNKQHQIQQGEGEQHGNESPLSKQQSIIIRNIKPIPVSPSHGQGIDILDMSSQAEQQINEEVANERAGSSFFHEIHSRLYKLQHNINSLNQNASENHKQDKRAQGQQNQQPVKAERERAIFRPSLLLEQTDNILKQLNAGLQQTDQHVLQQPVTVRQSKIASSQVRNQQSSHSLQKPQQQALQTKPQSKPIVEKADIIQSKPKKLLFSSNILNYHIHESTRHSEVHSEEKDKLGKEINVLQQVINELRVQRLKYQLTQNSRILQHPPEKTIYSNEQPHTTRNLLKLAESPPLTQDLSHFNVTSPTPMVQSSVSEYHNASSLSKYKIARSKSGKIVKNLNVFSESEMPKIEEQFIGETHIEQKVQEKQCILPKDTEKHSNVQTQKGSNGQTYQKNKGEQNLVQVKSPPIIPEMHIITEQKPKTQKDIVEQYLKKPQSKQQSFKIKNISAYPKHSSAATEHNKKAKAPAVNNQHNQSDLESSMPRTLINRHNHSNPPKITPQQHLQNVIKREKSANRQLLSQFEELNQKEPKYSTVQPQTLDPKRRANREGILKNIEPKIPPNITLQKTSGLKRKIYEMEQDKKVNEQPIKEQNKSRNFRTRRESESVRNSRASFSNKSTKSVGKDSRQKRQDNTVYVPALNPSLHHPLSPKEDMISHTRFDQAEFSLDPSAWDVKKRKIVFSNIKMPMFPEGPNPNITVENMILLIKQLGAQLSMQFKDKDLHRLVMKKFKNCIMLDLPGQNNRKLVWHYNQKVYLGGWDETAMEKHGEGIQYIPEKYYYQGEFVHNKRQGNGIMLFFNDCIYEGQWFEGQKHGKGKYQDKSLDLYYEGEWKEGKRNGIGYLQLQGQSRYEGSFSSNYRTGYGAEKFSNDDYYKGDYQLGKFHGKGAYIWASGSSYQGDFYEGLKHGQGKWRSGSGELYIGEFFEDKKQGHGRFIWQNGCIYQGEFALDKKNGRGVLKYADGRKVQGIWKNGQMIETTQVEYQEGRQQPLAYRKGHKFQTVTIIKGGEQKGKKFSISGRVSNY